MSSPAEMSPMRRWISLAICLAVGAAIWFSPVPEGVTENGWHVLAVFVATILSFILRPYPMGTMVLTGILILVLTHSFVDETSEKPSKEALAYALAKSYGDTTVWLVVAAFLISGAVIQTGFGKRIALVLIRLLGRTKLGLAWGIGAAELVLGPFVPSNTARGGGIVAPIVDSLCRTLANNDEGKRRNSVSSFLILTGAHANLITAAMFLTGMAANPIVSKAADEVADVNFDFVTWLSGSIVPGLIGLFLLPVFLRMLVKPSGIDVGAARGKASDELDAMGKMTRNEWILLGVFVLMLSLWCTARLHGIHTTVVALGGVVIILLTGVQNWKDMAKNHAAWDAMIWLGGLVMMAVALREFGVITWFAENAKGWVGEFNPLTATLALALIYFFSMYAFSMLTGHINAMVAAFIAVAVGVGAPPLLIVALLAYFSNLCGSLTHYSTGPVVIYFGMGYIEAPRWLKIGFLVSLFHLVIWLGIGLPYWKLLGWW
ncbi:MAG: DASS family sodium-coupled anion symporter [Verrucomicrobiales bacterium]|nr:DASS family sodium-coupled anion symporter [Verrucomicrobiales bacterium]